MGISEKITPKTVDQTQKFRNTAAGFFEAQLKTLGLSKKQIQRQSVSELEESLERVNDALRNSEAFGMLRLKMSSYQTIVR